MLRSLNPGVKLLVLIVASLVLSVTYNVRVNLAVFVVFLVLTLVTPGTNRKGLLLGLLPFFLTAAALFMTGPRAADALCEQLGDGRPAGEPRARLRRPGHVVCVHE